MDPEKNQLWLQNKEAFDQDFKTLKEVIDKHEAARQNYIPYIYQLITAIGVVAGFGFAGLPFVKSTLLFILGEALLFVAIAMGMRFVKRAFLDDTQLYANIIQELNDVMEERLKLSPSQSVEDIKKWLQATTEKELAIFDVKPNNIKSNLVLGLIFYAFILGGGFLLLSLLNLHLHY
jgi:hypothetical protein